MSTRDDRSRANDPARVRLAWPGQARDVPAPPSEPEAAPRIHAERVSAPITPDSEPGLRALEPVDDTSLGAPALRRAIVDAYDRLADRVLQRMRALHDDVDADLAELRSEVSSLRQAVDDMGDRVQLRTLRSAVDELRSDVVGMRRVLLEWPELERVSGDITALRADMTAVVASVAHLAGGELPVLPEGAARSSGQPLLEPLVEELEHMRDDIAELNSSVQAISSQRDRASSTLVAALAPVLEELGEIRAEVAQLSDGAPRSAAGDVDLSAVADELATMREELVSLRRRISLRAGG